MSKTVENDSVVLNLQDIQAIELETLLAFDAFCKKHGLRFYLCGGTLLGAVRHGGFIPWDDDIDIFMPRPDFDRLIDLSLTQSMGENFAIGQFRNGYLMRAFAKVFYTPTHVTHRYRKPEIGPHLWIDVLPVDGMPSDVNKLRRLLKKREWIGRMNASAMWKVGTGHRKKDIMKRWLDYPLAIAVGAKRWAMLMDRLARRIPYDTAEKVGAVTNGRYGVGEAMPREKFVIPAKVSFEGHEFETMSCYREYLSGIYGDYMTPPPEKNRIVHISHVTMARADYEKICEKYPALKDNR